MAYPVYQLFGTFRHEASHALAARLEGAEISQFVFWPTIQGAKEFQWGYVQWDGDTSWWTLAAPYFIDLITFIIFFWICKKIPFKRRWLWLNAVIIGLLSPLVNSLFNYGGSFRSSNDVGKLLVLLPRWSVHAYFVVTILLYVFGLLVALQHPRAIQTE